ncbi:hypothetical protein Tco_0110314 [Tanacetum coccineum]
MIRREWSQNGLFDIQFSNPIYELLPVTARLQFLMTLQDVDNGEPKTADDAQKKVKDGLNNENVEQERFADDISTKDVNAAGQHINTASPDVNTSSLKLNVVGLSVNTASPNEQDRTEEEPEVDLGNITNAYIVPTTPNTRIHKDHLIDNVIGKVKSTVQTKRMSKPTSEQGFLSDVKCQDITLQFKTLQQFSIWWILPNGKEGHWNKNGSSETEDTKGNLIRNISKVSLHRVIDKNNDLIDVRVFSYYGTSLRKKSLCYSTPGFKDPDHPYNVYKVVKTFGWHQATMSMVYVDDNYLWPQKQGVMLFGFEKLMKDKFQMSSMGELTFFLGLQLIWNSLFGKDGDADDVMYISLDHYDLGDYAGAFKLGSIQWSVVCFWESENYYCQANVNAVEMTLAPKLPV